MYPVSAAYMTAIGKPIKERRISGTVGGVAFHDSNIVKGTLKIDNQCSNGTELEIGSVYIGEMTCVFRGIDFTGEWMGKTITLTEELKVGDNAWEPVPIGVYHVVEAQHQETGVYVVAYDVMDYLDKPWSVSATAGKPWDYLMLIQQRTGIQYAQTEQEIQALPNGNTAFALYTENDISTFRDLLFWIAQLMVCFVTATRDGKLVFRQFGSTPIDEVGERIRWEGSSFSDYVTRYTGVSLTKADDQSTVYKHAEMDDGLTYNLGANPFLQTGNPDNALNAILTALLEIAYTPFSVDRSGCPMYDLGDVLRFPDGIGGNRIGCVMAYEYDYHDVYMIDGYGANPALYGAQSKAEKEIAGIASKNTTNQIQYYTYTNAEEYEIRSDYQEIISIRFGSSKQTLVTFQTEIALEAEIEEEDVESIINNIKYLWNGVEMAYKPVETWIEGKHLLHLLYLIPIQEAAINTFKVRINSEGGVTRIGRADLNAVISGQGLVASTVWDGWIECEDNITELTLASAMEVAAFVDECEIKGITPITIEIEDNIEVVNITNEPIIVKYGDAMYINRNPIGALTWYDVLYRVVPAANIYDPSVSYVPYDICYTLNGATHIEWRCTAETTGEFDESCWEVRTYNTWGEVYEYYGW